MKKTLLNILTLTVITLFMSACESATDSPDTSAPAEEIVETGTLSYTFDGQQHDLKTYSLTTTSGTSHTASVQRTTDGLKVSIGAQKSFNETVNSVSTLYFTFPNETVTTGTYHTDFYVLFMIDGKLNQTANGYDTDITLAEDDGTVIHLIGTTTTTYNRILSDGTTQPEPLVFEFDVKASR